MSKQNNNFPFSQRQLRVGELVKQSLGQIFLRGEAKIPDMETQNIILISQNFLKVPQGQLVMLVEVTNVLY